MNLTVTIQYLFPHAESHKDFLVMDDGDGSGAYIADWNLDAPIPSVEELTDAWEEFQANLPEPPKSIEEILLQENADLSFQVMVLEGEYAQLKQEQADLAFQLMMKEVL